MSLECVKCNKIFKSKHSLQYHLDKKNKCDSILECDNCKMKFQTKYKLQRHMNSKNKCIKMDPKTELLLIKNENIKLINKNILLINENLEVKKENIKLKSELDELKMKLKDVNLKDNIGRIYKIEYKNNENIRYIGSTTKTLKNRYAMHKNKYKKWIINADYAKCEIYEYFKSYNIENFLITLIEEYKIYNTEHLRLYEQKWLNNLVNINTNKAFSGEEIDKLIEYYENKI